MLVTAIAPRAALATPFTPAQLTKNRSFIFIDLSVKVTRNTETGLAMKMTKIATRTPMPMNTKLLPMKNQSMSIVNPMNVNITISKTNEKSFMTPLIDF